ncbi:hypothetical protein PR048_001553 [Dryococelus australis]|uniref:Uncharacterized protein n=1 Tax=Dryococelus australis TaxID=614101 RepID=A0ABQ9IHN8_9NEOP|nr:hypothetical protein PR048_001553 [Dryococelus australis]
MGILPDHVVGRQVFSRPSRFHHLCIPVLLHVHLISPSSALKYLTLRVSKIYTPAGHALQRLSLTPQHDDGEETCFDSFQCGIIGQAAISVADGGIRHPTNLPCDLPNFPHTGMNLSVTARIQIRFPFGNAKLVVWPTALLFVQTRSGDFTPLLFRGVFMATFTAMAPDNPAQARSHLKPDLRCIGLALICIPFSNHPSY